MRVILLQDIKNIGKKYEVKEVKNGYARNYLISKGIAKSATKEALKWLEVQKEIEGEKSEKELETIQKLASKIDGVEIIIPVKTGEKKQFFEKITSQKIVEKLKEIGFEVAKNQIDLKEPIRELGEFPIKIKFPHNLESKIAIIIVENK